MGIRRKGWERVVADYERSGLTQKTYALKRRMPLGTLQSWIYRRGREEKRARVQRLLPVRVATGNPTTVEIALPRGLVLRAPTAAEPGVVAALVRALE